jgi:hypothetical protein
VPAGFSVNAGRGGLAINCGPGYTTDADWYYPKEGQPDKLIYFQHGFLANAGVYNETLAELADRNNAIVVAPSITANKFDCYRCNSTSDPMHAAVAQLFVGDRAALAASAAEAGYEGELPEKFVFAGQSAGTQLASARLATTTSWLPLTRSPIWSACCSTTGRRPPARCLGRWPSCLTRCPCCRSLQNRRCGTSMAAPIRRTPRSAQVSSTVSSSSAVPHSDGFRTTKFGGLLQFFVGLLVGFSTPTNVEAVQELSQGWITDMYAGTVYKTTERTGIYGAPGEVIDIPTDTGTDAHAYVLPAPARQLSIIEQLIAFAVDSFGNLSFATCATQPATAASEQSAGPVQGCAAGREVQTPDPLGLTA